MIGGTQRATVLKEENPEAKVDCKMLIGYSEAELRSINIKDNTHAGEWDLDLLADWTADLNLDLGLELNNDKAQERKIDEMELIHYEKYDYVLIVCRDELSYNSLTRELGIGEKKVLLGPKKRPTKARAIWFDEMNVDFVKREQKPGGVKRVTFNIYVMSYGRAGNILTANNLEYCTYVVRKSEEMAYKRAGIESIWSIEDELINSCSKVMNYILDHAPEDVICIADDDIETFYHRTDTLTKLESKEDVTREIERLAQIVFDLNIGYGSETMDMSPKYYDRPFKFVGVTGHVKIFNLQVLNNRVDMKLKFLSDIDFEFKELIEHRIILIANYFCNNGLVDTNEGGNSSNKSLKEIEDENEQMKLKWGKYYQKANGGSAGRVKVAR